MLAVRVRVRFRVRFCGVLSSMGHHFTGTTRRMHTKKTPFPYSILYMNHNAEFSLTTTNCRSFSYRFPIPNSVFLSILYPIRTGMFFDTRRIGGSVLLGVLGRHSLLLSYTISPFELRHFFTEQTTILLRSSSIDPNPPLRYLVQDLYIS